MADEEPRRRGNGPIKAVKKLLLVTLLFVAGVLLCLAGFGMIEFNPNLFKYVGFGLLALALIYHLIY
jgi:hypothetical protein